ncbi:MAG: glutathione S-transferase N-terminal domain-containing protein [Burkholderiaceae bacterium]|uniref:Glutathione S-transferase N-terminal domain-containing protein n=1 Tax=Herminiimonas contaminans TaxID=1111140 RepID=A0ABS0EVC6_9BURK|nr:glutathione S-transferase [Herminiimonas contaminans]MBF8178801.1 glutathione S-transferase N-terminal domain-containing protein [Herminiimonas contaminans]MBX9798423.1 glutathione S-transferase N-terminal domain-containing protein [Burkholderiaceae bacterium]
MIKLYNYELSGNCYKLRLLMNILNVPYETVAIDFYPGREHKSKRFLEINPFGQLPVLEDGELRLRDAQAILVYLAAKYDAERTWYPNDPAAMGKIAMWLSVADDITRTASAARLHDALGYVMDIDKTRADAHALFRIIDEHLADMEVIGQQWLALDRPTIADIACFPYIAMSHEGDIMRDDYPAIRRWIERIRRLPGFVGMSGIFAPTI